MKKCAEKFGSLGKKSYICRHKPIKATEMTEKKLETLYFSRGDQKATIVTNGVVVRTYEPNESLQFSTLIAAIAHLEGAGWDINMHQEVLINE